VNGDEMSDYDIGDIIGGTDRTIVVHVGDGAWMTLPIPQWLWQLNHVRQEPDRGTKCDDRMLAVGVMESFLYLVENCTKEEAWRRIKIMRGAMRLIHESEAIASDHERDPTYQQPDSIEEVIEHEAQRGKAPPG
jgi:hypothetical protein